MPPSGPCCRPTPTQLLAGKPSKVDDVVDAVPGTGTSRTSTPFEHMFEPWFEHMFEHP